MNGLFFVLAVLVALPSPMRQELPSESFPIKAPTPTTALDLALKKLSLPCPDRIHVNDIISSEEGDRFVYRPGDMYDDCADEMDALVRTKEPIDDRLLQLGTNGKKLPERYRAAWILMQRRNAKVTPILEKMADSNVDHYSHLDLVQALNRRLNTSFRTLPALAKYLQRQRGTKEK
jgi:hypothetical protein